MSLWGGGLKELDLSSTDISGDGITTKLSQLQKLVLVNCENVTDSGVDCMLRSWGGGLKVVNLRWTNISSEVMIARFPHMLILR